MSSSKPAPFLETLQLYRDKRLWFVFLLGCSSGFPWVLIGSAMTGWLKDANLTRAAISYLGSVTAIYAFNFLWAPLVDRVHILGRQRLGQRRSWILWMQLAIVSLTIAMSYSNPANSVILTSALALSIGLFAATMDVAIDGYRIDIFADEANFLPAAAAMAVAGWWTGYSLPGYVAFHYADQIGWPAAYQLLAFILLVLVIVTLLIPEPASNRDLLQQKAAERYNKALRHPVSLWLTITVVEPFADFFRRNGVKVAMTLIAFILVFKIGEAFLGRMSIQFYREVGFSNEQIADYSKLIGWGATIAFTLLGSLINMRFGVMKGLVIGGITMAGSNLMFAWIAQVGPNETLLLCTILVDNFTTAFSAVAFVAFLTSFTGVAFSASQYALLASIGNFGRTSMAAVSGEFVDWLNGDWTLFFIFTSLMVVPGLLLLWSIDRKLKAKKPAAESA